MFEPEQWGVLVSVQTLVEFETVVWSLGRLVTSWDLHPDWLVGWQLALNKCIREINRRCGPSKYERHDKETLDC